MNIKQIELRDRGTFIPILAMQVSMADGWLFSRAGFGEMPLVILMNLSKMECQYDPFAWRNPRTLGTAHQWIQEHWDIVADGGVVDVEFILGERPEPKRSER